jgi:putative PIN family toxin of toxin-antitoxin system
MKIVLDTNVLVSALWNAEGAPAKVVRLLGDGQLQLVTSPAILAEYREVLTRKRFGFDPMRVAQILEFFGLVGMNVPGTASQRKLPDTKDHAFLDAALEAKAEYLVTGNLKDFPEVVCLPVKPLGPTAFLALWLGAQDWEK